MPAAEATARRLDARPEVRDAAGARGLIADLVAVMSGLQDVLARETDHLRAGRLRQGLSEEREKAELAAQYLRGLAAIKANAIALARFAPEALSSLRRTHDGLQSAVDANQRMLATARAVSESLLKGLADEMARQKRPQLYAPPRASSPTVSGSPLVFSKAY